MDEFKCSLCKCNTYKNDIIKLYLSEINDVFCCPICKLSSLDNTDLSFYCLKCGHKICENCVEHINLQENNRLYNISKLLLRMLRYSNHTFIGLYNGVISASIKNVYDNLDKHSMSPQININEIYTIINTFNYRNGRKMFGLSIINEIEYIDTDTRMYEY
jgi:hypothetical protein